MRISLFVAYIITINDKLDTNRQVNGYVIFKIDGKTLTDNNGETIQIPITDNTATYNYTIGPEYSIRKHTITTVLVNNTYVRSQANNTFNTTQTTTTINVAPLSMTPNSNTQLTGTITDTNGNNVKGTNKIAVKIDGTTIKDNNGEPQYYYIQDGQINIPITNNNYTTGEHTIEVVTGERNAYTAARTNTTLTITQAQKTIEKTTNKKEKTTTITNKEFINIQTTTTNTNINTTKQITLTITDTNNKKITTGTITWKQKRKNTDNNKY